MNWDFRSPVLLASIISLCISWYAWLTFFLMFSVINDKNYLAGLHVNKKNVKKKGVNYSLFSSISKTLPLCSN